MSEQPRAPEGEIKQELASPEPVIDDAVSEKQFDIKNDIKLKEVESEIIFEQIQKLESDKEAHDSLDLLDQKENPYRYVYPREAIFLQSFCRPPYYMPKERKAAYRDGRDIELLYSFAPVSPMLIDSLCKKVFGIEFKHELNSELGLRERAEYIEAIRGLFANLVPIHNKDKKVVRRRKKDKSTRMFAIPLEIKRGAVLVSRKPGKRRFNNVYEDIYSAQRAQDHIDQVYTGRFSPKEIYQMGELEFLRIMREEVQNMISFLQHWKQTNPEQREKAECKIEELESKLSEVINDYKVQAREQFENSREIKDKKGKKNPGAISARMVASYNRLRKRTGQVFDMQSSIADDKRILDELVEDLNKNIFNRLRDLSAWISKQKYFSEFSELKAANSYLRSTAGKVNDELEKKMASFVEMKDDLTMPAPFPQIAEAVLSNFRVVYGLNQNIANEEIPFEKLEEAHNLVCEYAIKAQLPLRYGYIQYRFMHLLRSILKNPHNVEAEDLKESMESLRKAFRPHLFGEAFPLRDDIKFQEDTFEDVFDLINEVHDDALAWQEATANVLKQQNPLKEEVEEKGTDDESKVEKVLAFQDKLQQLEHGYLTDIYELISKFDFMQPIKRLTLEDAKLKVQEIIFQLQS